MFRILILICFISVFSSKGRIIVSENDIELPLCLLSNLVIHFVEY